MNRLCWVFLAVFTHVAEVVLSLTVSVNVSSQDQDQGSLPDNVENVQKVSTESKVLQFFLRVCECECVLSLIHISEPTRPP